MGNQGAFLDLMADVDQRPAGRIPEAGACLREASALLRRPADRMRPARLPRCRRAPVRGDRAMGRGHHIVGRARRAGA